MYAWLEAALAERFEPVALLKESERGSVAHLRHRDTGTRFILRRMTGSGEVYRRLLDVRCPNLPTIFETASDGEKTLVLEEFIQGDNLADLINADPLPRDAAVRTARQLCRALWVLHSLGAVHRDVKPENVLIRGGEAVLIDFNAARLFKATQATDTVALGTAGFAAPEQFGLTQTDERADIYSMGVLLNMLLTGEHPSKKLSFEKETGAV